MCALPTLAYCGETNTDLFLGTKVFCCRVLGRVKQPDTLSLPAHLCHTPTATSGQSLGLALSAPHYTLILLGAEASPHLFHTYLRASRAPDYNLENKDLPGLSVGCLDAQTSPSLHLPSRASALFTALCPQLS